MFALQVLAIKRAFDKNLKELYLCYLKSPKHGEFGLSRFWGYLNYNEYYSDANEIGKWWWVGSSQNHVTWMSSSFVGVLIWALVGLLSSIFSSFSRGDAKPWHGARVVIPCFWMLNQGWELYIVIPCFRKCEKKEVSLVLLNPNAFSCVLLLWSCEVRNSFSCMISEEWLLQDFLSSFSFWVCFSFSFPLGGLLVGGVGEQKWCLGVGCNVEWNNKRFYLVRRFSSEMSKTQSKGRTLGDCLGTFLFSRINFKINFMTLFLFLFL